MMKKPIQLKDCCFRFSHYAESLERAQRLGYECTSMRDYDPSSSKALVLRHDVDYTLDGVMDFAQIEADLGMTSTFFIRLHAREYNPWNFASYTCFRALREMGHEIGLHYDCVNFQVVTGEDPAVIFRKEKHVLETILDVEIQSASQHRDISNYSFEDYYFFSKYDKKDFGIENYVFDDKFFKDMKYISDSNGIWRDGCLCKNLGKHPKLQVLTHADIWFRSHYHLKESPVHHDGIEPVHELL